MNKRERNRLETSILIICGFWHTCEEWTKVLMPFTQWTLQPKPTLFDLLSLNAFTSFCILVGTVIVAQIIEVQGLRRTAIFCTVVTSLYQIMVSKIRNFYIFTALQTLLAFSHVPMVIYSCVVHLEGEDGDDKRRTRFLNRLTIPMSIGIAIGPYFALQMLFFLTSDINTSQTICGLMNLIGNVTMACLYLPDNKSQRSFQLPQLEPYLQLVRNPKTKWCLLLLMMVIGPFSAYDQVVRISLSAAVASDPQQLTKLFLILGAASVVGNVWIVPFIQSRAGPQHVLMGSFLLLTASYLYLSTMTSHISLFIGMPIQIVALSICIGELSSQIISTVGKHDAGKVSALIRMSHMLAMVMVPLLTGYYVERDETSILCYVSAVVSLAAVPILNKFCVFMKAHAASLPISGKLD
ncbi:unnamed protein product [Auanema sp. JU1783]|nr:unnamed protein product [Auanema sp. JU1783]